MKKLQIELFVDELHSIWLKHFVNVIILRLDYQKSFVFNMAVYNRLTINFWSLKIKFQVIKRQ